MSLNGMSLNGLTVNALYPNGLSVNALNVNGMSVNALQPNGAHQNEAPGIQVEPEEARSFDMEEGTFFGNIFGREPAAYVCGPGHDADRQAHIRAQQRICALPLPQRLPDDRQVTACRFVYVGPCTESSFTQDGVPYREAVTVSLRAEP